jgi:hypothetical protein
MPLPPFGRELVRYIAISSLKSFIGFCSVRFNAFAIEHQLEEEQDCAVSDEYMIYVRSKE